MPAPKGSWEDAPENSGVTGIHAVLLKDVGLPFFYYYHQKLLQYLSSPSVYVGDPLRIFCIQQGVTPGTRRNESMVWI